MTTIILRLETNWLFDIFFYLLKIRPGFALDFFWKYEQCVKALLVIYFKTCLHDEIMVAVEYMGKLLDDVLKQFSLRRVGCVVSDKKNKWEICWKNTFRAEKVYQFIFRVLGEILVEVYFWSRSYIDTMEFFPFRGVKLLGSFGSWQIETNARKTFHCAFYRAQLDLSTFDSSRWAGNGK